jgi:hypothetical protein
MLKKIVEKAKEEVRILKGEETVDKLFTSENDYPDIETARQAFARSKEKLFDVDAWSELPGISSTFQLHDKLGTRKEGAKPEVGDYIWIDLPGPLPKNWVQVVSLSETEMQAGFTVSPSENPQERATPGEAETKHFFTQDATSTFVVELQGTRLVAKEIGKDEVINNQGEEAGSRKVINTLIAEGGWAFFQRVQWQKLTDYLVHKLINEY